MNKAIGFERIRKVTMGAEPVLSVGTLTADIMDQQSAVQTLEEQGIELLHVDIMDGRVWPKITVGHFFVGGLTTTLIKDVHLLVEEPTKQIPFFVEAGADMIAFSVESCDDVAATVEVLRNAASESGREKNVRCGLSVYPTTSLEFIKPYVDQVDYVTLVSIGPETGRKNFLHEMTSRVSQLRSWRQDLLICIDGAVKKNNIGEVAAMGANVVVTGSAIFDGNDPTQNIIDMKKEISLAFNS